MDIVVVLDTPALPEDFISQLAAYGGGRVILWDYLHVMRQASLDVLRRLVPAGIYREQLGREELRADSLFLFASVENKTAFFQAFIFDAIPARAELQAFSIFFPLNAADLPAHLDYGKLPIEFLRGCYEEVSLYPERVMYVRCSCWQYLEADVQFSNLPELVKVLGANGTKGVLLPELCALYAASLVEPLRPVPDRLRLLRRFLELRAAVKNGRHTLLYVIHADFHPAAENNIGGTQFHVRDLVRYFRYYWNVLVLAKDRDGLRVTLYQDDARCSLRFFVPGPPLGIKFTSAAYGQIYGLLMDFFQVELLHVHHTMDLSLTIFDEAQKRKIPVCLTIHDYYYVCPRIKLVCNRQQRDRQGCNACLRSLYGLPKGRDYIAEWQAASERILGMCRAVFAPSVSAQNVFTAFFPGVAEKVQVVEHGVTVPDSLLGPQRIYEASAREHPFRVAFIGSLTPEKGSRLILDVLRQPSKNIEWHIFGGIDDPALAAHQQKNLIKHGRYEQNEIVTLLQKQRIDLVCILSLWQETYCYTLTETLMAGIPALVSSLGAVGERVRQLQCGWILEDGLQPELVAAQIVQIATDRAAYEAVYRRVRRLQFKPVEAMDKEYRQAYDVLLADSQPQWGEGLMELWNFCGQLAAHGEGRLFAQADGTLPVGDEALRAELERMQRTRGWQLLQRLRTWRNQVKKLFGRKS